MTKYPIKILCFSFVSFFLLMLALPVEQAEAGVLLRSSRASISYSGPRVRDWRVKRSTYVTQRYNPVRRHQEVGTVADDFRLAKQRYKYEKKLYKWEKKRQKRISKMEKRRQKRLESLAKKREKELRKLKKKQESQTMQGREDARHEPAVAAKKGLSDDRVQAEGKADGDGAKSTKKKKTFWATFWQTIVGKK